ncbi:MAG: hypothetical protein JWO06_526, partial [Bacteroidota bacterium]|nr:hypothetical protein [Bacteroidota bacterium]
MDKGLCCRINTLPAYRIVFLLSLNNMRSTLRWIGFLCAIGVFLKLIFLIPLVNFFLICDLNLLNQNFPHFGKFLAPFRVILLHLPVYCFLLSGFILLPYLLAFIFSFLVRRRKEVVVFIFSLLLCLIVAEFALRIYGFKPGRYIEPTFFKEVDRLISIRGYVADENAMTHLDTFPRKALTMYISQRPNETFDHFARISTDTVIGDYNEMADNFSDVISGRDSGIFAGCYKGILLKAPSER